MAIVKGEWQLRWNNVAINDIEEIEVDYERSSDDYETVQYVTRTIYGSTKATIGLTVLASDIPTLAAIFPQYYVPMGGTLSTGESVTSTEGAIDVKSNCDDPIVYSNLDIISCGDPGEVFRLVNAYTELETVEFDGKVRKVIARFIGEPESTEASVQFFGEGGINPIS